MYAERGNPKTVELLMILLRIPVNVSVKTENFFSDQRQCRFLYVNKTKESLRDLAEFLYGFSFRNAEESSSRLFTLAFKLYCNIHK